MIEPILVARQVSKQFPGVRALDNVDLELIPGEVHALVGENGAGKSTLIKVLGGQHRPTSGTILINGQPVHFDNPLQSQAAGISVINQEFNLIPQLTIAENIFLGREPVRQTGTIDWNTIRQRSATSLRELGLNIAPTLRVEYLSVADKQLVEVAKALSRDFRIMIMDEPTATLNSAEVDRLFEIIASMRQRGIAVLYVSHRLSEVFRIADRVTVLRDGKRVDTCLIKGLAERDVITMMLGRALDEREVEKVAASDRPVALSAVQLAIPGALGGVSFELHYGEVVGVAGLIGSGRSEMMRALYGILPHSGTVQINGQHVAIDDPGEALRAGIFMLPEDRKTEGLFLDLDVLENLVIKRPRHQESTLRRLLLAGAIERDLYQQVGKKLAIRAHSFSQLVATLSGGNQQKVMLGRALVSEARILLLNEPSRGVDVGTKVEIHELIRQLAKNGNAVMVSSSDVPELVKVSDRCLVLNAGILTGSLHGSQVSEDNILACAIGHTTVGVS
ncbi:MAG TPA: sugar ABC transporter ATP-binding protein [Aggregatilineaceae bacterium]|nr:sugar ABC transporter ATP-binding protein [Aggregatilineaceae bacterium]